MLSVRSELAPYSELIAPTEVLTVRLASWLTISLINLAVLGRVGLIFVSAFKKSFQSLRALLVIAVAPQLLDHL